MLSSDHRRSIAVFAAIIATALAGCSRAPPLTYSGFLTDYAALAKVSDQRMHYVSPEVDNYQSFIVDPIQVQLPPGKLSEEGRQEIAAYFRDAIIRVLAAHGYTEAPRASAGTARIRVAVTNIHKSTWWMKIHPASSLAGAGRGGATMEGEAVDSVSGRQIAAVVQSGVGSQFTVLNLSTVSDIKSAIDEWAKDVSARLAAYRGGAGKTAPP